MCGQSGRTAHTPTHTPTSLTFRYSISAPGTHLYSLGRRRSHVLRRPRVRLRRLGARLGLRHEELLLVAVGAVDAVPPIAGPDPESVRRRLWSFVLGKACVKRNKTWFYNCSRSEVSLHYRAPSINHFKKISTPSVGGKNLEAKIKIKVKKDKFESDVIYSKIILYPQLETP